MAIHISSVLHISAEIIIDKMHLLSMHTIIVGICDLVVANYNYVMINNNIVI